MKQSESQTPRLNKIALLVGSLTLVVTILDWLFPNPLTELRGRLPLLEITFTILLAVFSINFLAIRHVKEFLPQQKMEPHALKRDSQWLLILLVLCVTSALSAGFQLGRHSSTFQVDTTGQKDATLERTGRSPRLDLDSYCKAKYGNNFRIISAQSDQCHSRERAVTIDLNTACFEAYGSTRHYLDPSTQEIYCTEPNQTAPPCAPDRTPCLIDSSLCCPEQQGWLSKILGI